MQVGNASGKPRYRCIKSYRMSHSVGMAYTKPFTWQIARHHSSLWAALDANQSADMPSELLVQCVLTALACASIARRIDDHRSTGLVGRRVYINATADDRHA